MAIIQNKKARFDYEIEEKFEAGLELRGWEVKSIRAGGASIKEAHVFVRNGELFLLNANITPLKTASTHEKADPTRNRKLLLHKHEIMRLIGRVEQAGYSLIPLDMHFKDGRVKLELGLGKGKKLFEKRADIGKREWKREQGRLLKTEHLTENNLLSSCRMAAPLFVTLEILPFMPCTSCCYFFGSPCFCLSFLSYGGRSLLLS